MNKEMVELQIKVAHLEDTVDALNNIVARQNQELQNFQDLLKLLYQNLDNKDNISAFDLLKDKPPHY